MKTTLENEKMHFEILQAFQDAKIAATGQRLTEEEIRKIADAMVKALKIRGMK